nr:MAG TPA: hypothetical protein [Caudoviricetes sp.]
MQSEIVYNVLCVGLKILILNTIGFQIRLNVTKNKRRNRTEVKYEHCKQSIG